MRTFVFLQKWNSKCSVKISGFVSDLMFHACLATVPIVKPNKHEQKHAFCLAFKSQTDSTARQSPSPSAQNQVYDFCAYLCRLLALYLSLLICPSPRAPQCIRVRCFTLADSSCTHMSSSERQGWEERTLEWEMREKQAHGGKDDEGEPTHWGDPVCQKSCSRIDGYP